MPTLHFLPGACSLVPHICLHWLGVEHEAVRARRQDLKSAAFLAMNPAGAAPVLVDGDFALSECVAIVGYLHDTHPAAGLLGDGSARQRAEATRWMCHLNTDVHKSFVPLFAAARVSPDEAHHEALKAQARANLRGHFERLDAHLARAGEWLANGRRGPADAYLFTVMRWAAGTGVDLAGLTHLAAHHARMEADAGVQAALAAEAASLQA